MLFNQIKVYLDSKIYLHYVMKKEGMEVGRKEEESIIKSWYAIIVDAFQ